MTNGSWNMSGYPKAHGIRDDTLDAEFKRGFHELLPSSSPASWVQENSLEFNPPPKSSQGESITTLVFL